MPSYFTDTRNSVLNGVRLHVTLKIKNNDDSIDFSGVGGGTKTHLRRSQLLAIGNISSSQTVFYDIFPCFNGNKNNI